VRRVREALKAGDIGKAEQEYVLAASRLDRAGARNLIHRNVAARTKSRLQKVIRRAKGVTPSTTAPSAETTPSA
jgi:small subunit ribosomal protein S20